ncbi:MAG: hypothetical protein M0P74_02345 [Syntrophales bacterium]|nr:hypothetical protein [Syntrophales bacterium]
MPAITDKEGSRYPIGLVSRRMFGPTGRLRRQTSRQEEAMVDYWSGKTPCWDFLGCTEQIHLHCAAYRHRELPCWEVAGTQCRKILDFEWECRDCKVFKLYNPGGKRL